jgi:hypothetical protein
MGSISRPEFSQEVMNIIYHVCRLIYNLHSHEDIERVFNLDNTKLQEIINQIVQKLPEEIFNGNHHDVKELQQIFAKEFIFFQIQENVHDPMYQNDLNNFVSIFARDIHSKLQAWKEEHYK